MSGRAWWLVERMAGALESEERDAVLGDFAESGVRTRRALVEISGLIARRQAAVWTREFRPWLALVTLVIPLGVLLSLASRGIADSSAIDVFIYVDNWTWSYITNPGARSDFVDRTTGVLLNDVTLAAWSVTTGFALASVAGRGAPVAGVLFFTIFLAFEKLLSGPRYAHNAGNAAVFDLPFYGAVSPVLVQLLLVVIPACGAMAWNWRIRRLPVPLVTIGALAVVVLTIRAAPGLYFWTFWPLPPWVWLLLRDSSLWVLPAVLLAWPAVFTVVRAATQTSFGSPVSR